MPSQPPRGFRAKISDTTARQEAVTLAAYHDALSEFRTLGWSRRLLLEHLGDLDQQASHAVADARLALAGRLIAAAQVAERVRLPEPQVQGIVRAWLADHESQRDDAAPAVTPRVAPEAERISGLTRRLSNAEHQGGFSRAAWGIAGMVLQHLIRPSVDVSRALALRETLDPLAGVTRRLIDEGPPHDAGGNHPNCLLTSTVIRVRADGQIVTDPARGARDRREAWLRIAGDTAGAHGRWSQAPIEQSVAQARTRATDRLAASVVPEEPQRFDHGGAVEHAVQATFDAAVTALGLTTQPREPTFVRGMQDVLEALMEATSSGLVGAWVCDRRHSWAPEG